MHSYKIYIIFGTCNISHLIVTKIRYHAIKGILRLNWQHYVYSVYLPILQKRFCDNYPHFDRGKWKGFMWNSISLRMDYIIAFVKRFTHKNFNKIEAQTTNKVVKIAPFWEFGVLFCQPDTLLRQLASPFHLPCHKDE